MLRRIALTLAAAACLCPLGCGQVEGPPAGFPACAPEPDGGAPEAGAVTPPTPDYWHDVKPILDARCATCHTADGIAPFPILTYREASSSALLIQGAVMSRAMPPWPPNACCQKYRHDRSLSQAEIDTIVRWTDGGTPEGDPVGAPPSMPPGPPMLSRVDVSLRMAEPYTPVAQEGTSELRCFLIEDWPFDTEKYVTGVDVRPGNRAIVHHVIVQTVGGGDVAALRAREGLDGRPGFDCRNLRGEIHVNGAVGSWTPGQTPFESSDGVVGVPFPAHSQIMLQVHYDVRNGVTKPDQTEIDFQVTDTVEHRAKGMVVANPLWLAGDGLGIEAGDPDAVHTFAYDPTTLVTHGHSFYVLTVNLHMHFLGSRGRVAIHRKGGPWDCLLDIPRWDYHWASYYELAEPVRVDPGDMLYVECHWDNTAANQTPVNGAVGPPRDLHWATAEEMCAGVMLYSDTWP